MGGDYFTQNWNKAISENAYVSYLTEHSNSFI